uniref:Ovule protein n=1 Tax=Anisakis simplex TaxID=6269 RepID=A0A0M3JC73_ANISI
LEALDCLSHPESVMIIGWDSARRPQLGRVETSSIKDKSLGSDDNDRIAHVSFSVILIAYFLWKVGDDSL